MELIEGVRAHGRHSPEVYKVLVTGWRRYAALTDVKTGQEIRRTLSTTRYWDFISADYDMREVVHEAMRGARPTDGTPILSQGEIDQLVDSRSTINEAGLRVTLGIGVSRIIPRAASLIVGENIETTTAVDLLAVRARGSDELAPKIRLSSRDSHLNVWQNDREIDVKTPSEIDSKVRDIFIRAMGHKP